MTALILGGIVAFAWLHGFVSGFLSGRSAGLHRATEILRERRFDP